MLASPIISTDGAPHVLASAKDLALPPVFGILGIFYENCRGLALPPVFGILGIFHRNYRDGPPPPTLRSRYEEREKDFLEVELFPIGDTVTLA